MRKSAKIQKRSQTVSKADAPVCPQIFQPRGGWLCSLSGRYKKDPKAQLPAFPHAVEGRH